MSAPSSTPAPGWGRVEPVGGGEARKGLGVELGLGCLGVEIPKEVF